jgi:hypothetical protein
MGSPFWGFYPLFVKTLEKSRGFAFFGENGRIPVVVNKDLLPMGVTMDLDSMKKNWILFVFLFGLLVFVGAMTNSLFNTVDNLEIHSVDYDMVAEIGHNYSELLPFIRKICEDGKITEHEFIDLKGFIPALQKERFMKEFKQ